MSVNFFPVFISTKRLLVVFKNRYLCNFNVCFINNFFFQKYFLADLFNIVHRFKSINNKSYLYDVFKFST